MTKKFRILVIALVAAGALSVWVIHSAYRKVYDHSSLENFSVRLKKEFPDVDHISTSQLVTLQRAAEAGVDSLLLVDCRSEEEFSVSRIPGAVHLTSASELAALLSEENEPFSHIVIYGSTGLRSAKLARQLGKAGRRDVQNLTGSIFQWANENRPLVDPAGNPATVVHPFNTFWKRCLAEGRAAPVEIH